MKYGREICFQNGALPSQFILVWVHVTKKKKKKIKYVRLLYFLEQHLTTGSFYNVLFVNLLK